jgi:hypothetical protein
VTVSSQSASNVVRKFIDDDPVVRHGLERGVINARALARQIKAETGTEGSLGAITAAIWRYPVRDSAPRSRSVGALIAALTLRDRISAFGVVNSEEAWKTMARLPESIDASKGETLRIISGLEATTVVIDSKNSSKLRSMLPKGSIGRAFEDLAEIIIHLHEASWEATGVLSGLATELALNGVSIAFHFGYGPPPCIVFEVHEKDAIKGYQALEKLRKSAES